MEEAFTSLEGGNDVFAFSSGMSAVSTAIHLLKSGDHVVACDFFTEKRKGSSQKS
ncbi:MAG: PLP-dependent transferase [Methanobacteriaceae archaeon]|nr:PLP-dependent transferase [Methanobacteriaceae archaeon]